jgi:YVTN family beta-propeller protein
MAVVVRCRSGRNRGKIAPSCVHLALGSGVELARLPIVHLFLEPFVTFPWSFRFLAVLALACTLLPGMLGAQTLPIFVLNSLDASVSVIDAASWTETRRLSTGKEPHHLYLTPDEKSIIVGNAGSDSLTFIDPRTAEIQRTVRNVLDPYHLRFSPDMKWFVTAGNRLHHVDLYRWDGATLILARRIPTGKTPSHIWIDSRSTTAYVTMQDSDELVAIDLASQALRWRIKTGPLPADVYGLPDDRQLLVGMTGSDSVEVYDVSGPAPRLAQRIRTGAGAHAFRSAGDRRHVYVSNRVANSISKIDLQTLQVVGSYPAPGGPDCIEVLAGGRFLLTTSRWAKRLTVIDTQTAQVVRSVRVGKSPHGVWTLDHAPR